MRRHTKCALVTRVQTCALSDLALMVLGGCSQLRGRQGYVVDPVLTQAITPGVDNRESVEKTLGHPSFVSQFSDNEYYYLSRETRQRSEEHTSGLQSLMRISYAVFCLKKKKKQIIQYHAKHSEQ